MNFFRRLFGRALASTPSSPDELVRYFQEFGFFKGESPHDVLERYEESHSGPLTLTSPWDDIFLLAESPSRVWASDPEADVCAENQVYSEVLPEWAAITGGLVRITNMTESWGTETGPISLQFNLNGKPATLSPSYQDDWIDLDVLCALNELVRHLGVQFECAVDGNFALVTCLRPDEKRRLVSERALPFAW